MQARRKLRMSLYIGATSDYDASIEHLGNGDGGPAIQPGRYIEQLGER